MISTIVEVGITLLEGQLDDCLTWALTIISSWGTSNGMEVGYIK